MTIKRSDAKFLAKANYEIYKFGIWPRDCHNIVILHVKMTEANVWKDGIMQQIRTNFDSLKVDSCGVTVVGYDAKYRFATCNELIRLSLLFKSFK